ncbi:hypothetical protein [Nocardiopsis sp. CNT-189]|uniref:TPR repeat region-containing protein n=1 Tax=Nocardiopsis oceanisediminis TaxID=2816862 RepID=UPI003B3AD653
MELYATGQRPIDDRYYEIIAALNAVNARALESQRRGAKLSEDEIAFLEGFHTELGNLEKNGAQGALAVPFLLDEMGLVDSEGNPTQEGADLLKTLGGGILVLSNADYGGGFDRLPPELQALAYGPQADYYGNFVPPQTDPSSSEAPHEENTVRGSAWRSGMLGLAGLFEGVDENLRGGKAFSAGITTSIAHNMNLPDSLSEPARELMGALPEKDINNILEVSTRNPEANHAILTGQHDHRYYGSDPSKTIENLFTYNWEDDEAVSGLIDWIPEYGSPMYSEETRTMAGEASAALIGIMTNPEMFDSLTNTGLQKDTSFTAYNVTIADSLTDIFERYVVSFADSTLAQEKSGSKADIGAGDFYVETNKIAMGGLEAVRFMQYLVGNDYTAARTLGIVDEYINVAYGAALVTGDTVRYAESSGGLSSLYNSALSNEAMARGIDEAEANKRNQKIADLSIEIGKAALPTSRFPVVAESVGFLIDVAKEPTFKYLFPTPPPAEMRLNGAEVELKPEMIERRFQIMSLGHSLSGSDGVISKSELDSLSDEEYKTLVDDYGVIREDRDGNYRVEVDPEKWKNYNPEDTGADDPAGGTDNTKIDQALVNSVTGEAEDRSDDFVSYYEKNWNGTKEAWSAKSEGEYKAKIEGKKK